MINQELWVEVIRSATIGIVVIRPDGHLEMCNNAFEKITGYQEKELQILDWNKVLTPPEWEELETSKLEQLKKTKQPVQFEKEYIRKNGSRAAVSLTVHPYIEDKKQSSLYFACITDITHQKNYEKTLTEYSEKFRSIQSLAKMGTWELDAVTNTLVWDDEVYRIFEFEPHEIKVTLEDFYHFIHEYDIENVQKTFAASLELKEPYEIEHRIRTKLGNIKFVKEKCITKFDEKGKPKLSRGIIIDITAVKEAENNLIQAKNRAESYLDLAGSMIVSLDKSGQIILINQKGLEILGYNRSELLGKNWFDTCIPKKIAGEVKHIFNQLMQGLVEPAEFYENAVITKLGETKLVAWHNTVITDEFGIVTGLLSSGVDITQIKNMQQEVLEVNERFDQAMQATQDGIFDWNLLTNEIYYSPGWKRMLGYSYDELPNDFSVWETLTRPEDVQRSWNLQQELISRKRDRFEIEFKMKHKDGHWIDILSRAAAVFNNEGRAVRIVGTHVDISRQKLIEEALKQSESKYKQLVETASDSIFLISKEGNIIDVNETACFQLGRTREEFLTLSIGDVDSGFSTEEFKRVWEEIPLNQLEIFETTHLHKDGTLIPVEISGKKFKINDEIFYYGIARDMRERNRLRDEQQQLQEQLTQNQKLESIGRLAGGVAHDFNNMLSVILGQAELALENLSEEEPLYTALNEIKKAAEHSAELTRQLLTFARRQTVNSRALDLNETIESMLNMMNRLVGENIRLIWEPSAMLEPVKIDPTQINQILTNLIINARSAIHDIGKITIRTGKIEFDEKFCAAHMGLFPAVIIVFRYRMMVRAWEMRLKHMSLNLFLLPNQPERAPVWD